MRRLGSAVVGGMLSVLLAHAPTAAQSSGGVYNGQANIYHVNIPPGWSEVDGGDNVDAVFAPPAGKAYGSIFVGVMYARRTLDDEVDHAARNDATQGRRHLSLDGMPCVYLASTGSRGERDNHLACQFTAPFDSGPRKVTFFMGSASRPQEYAAQTEIFWRMANSLRWAPEIRAQVGDDQEDDDQNAQAAEDAPGTWILYLSPPGTGNADPLPPYDQWKVFQRYQGLADCLAARYPAHMKYWDSDQDLSMRALHGICYNPDTREIRGAR